MPSIPFPREVGEQAAELVESLALGCSSKSGFGSFTSVAYDSAWVSLVQKTVEGAKRWRFPECFQYVLDSQAPDGGWIPYTTVFTTEVDALLNAMAALLTLRRHSTEPLNCKIPHDLVERISRATKYVQDRLETWDVKASEQVGFEVLVPNLLELLEQEGILFRVPGLQVLRFMKDQKLAKFNPKILYQPVQLTLIHSMEALSGKVDFNRVAHHKVFGSMMASPAATAAYLMYSSNWDQEAEDYLSNVITNASGKGSGGVPSAFPTHIFELTWILSTLLLAGYTVEELGIEKMGIMGDFLEQSLEIGNGLVGFAPGLLVDADDTAKSLLTLNLLGRPASPKQMIETFEVSTHFKTYTAERNPSFSANCNILCALLHDNDPNSYADQIYKATSYLCNSWWEGSYNDKWNTSSLYSMMLLSQTLMRLLHLWKTGRLSALSDRLAAPSTLADRIPIVLFQILDRTLRSQSLDGSWGNGSPEISAYAILTLIHLSPLRQWTALQTETEAAITSGQSFLRKLQLNGASSQSDLIWIEKVSYGLPTLCQCYCLAALKASTADKTWDGPNVGLGHVPLKAVGKFLGFFSRLPLFKSLKDAEWKLRSSLVEGYLFLPLLKRVSRDIFPREGMEAEQYLEYIPLTWTTSNSLQQVALSASFLQEMMEISMLNYQADEFMEAVVGKEHDDDLESVKEIIVSLTTTGEKRLRSDDEDREEPYTKKRSIGSNGFEKNFQRPTTPPRSASGFNIKKVLGQFVRRIMGHSKVIKASARDQLNLRRELRDFLLAHLDQIEDNTWFSREDASHTETKPFTSPRTTYFDWVRTSSADHTSCPYSFAFVKCLAASGPAECFHSAYSNYLAQDLCTHLATMCRQYNDYGSVQRDRDERNLNSINFPDFHIANLVKGVVNEPASVNGIKELASTTASELIEMNRKRDDELKAALFEIAEYERSCLTMTLQRLKSRIPAQTRNVLSLFVNVTDLYGQIYVARDIGSRVS